MLSRVAVIEYVPLFLLASVPTNAFSACNGPITTEEGVQLLYRQLCDVQHIDPTRQQADTAWRNNVTVQHQSATPQEKKRTAFGFRTCNCPARSPVLLVQSRCLVDSHLCRSQNAVVHLVAALRLQRPHGLAGVTMSDATIDCLPAARLLWPVAHSTCAPAGARVHTKVTAHRCPKAEASSTGPGTCRTATHASSAITEMKAPCQPLPAACTACVHTLVTTAIMPASLLGSGTSNMAWCKLGSNFWPPGLYCSTPCFLKTCKSQKVRGCCTGC